MTMVVVIRSLPTSPSYEISARWYWCIILDMLRTKIMIYLGHTIKSTYISMEVTYINNYFSLLLFLLLQISKILGRTTVNIKISEPGLHFLFIKNQ